MGMAFLGSFSFYFLLDLENHFIIVSKTVLKAMKESFKVVDVSCHRTGLSC
ncbi:hypothetical protein MIZ03_0701 [Rhodoferax lithotrophicus]|uniref:Uncharacterized protein n=1 Tax=Rhodoferax lithotrophicus TaxID=2798804 RepID=A0ABN6D1H7_9BURK|nr:hypothetical protein MIZ03_0701 [Rhodoferax sp. MIZ03]